MASLVVALRRPRPARFVASAEARERWVRRRVAATWALVVLNVLTFNPGQSVIPIPSIVGKGITQGALPLALLLALTVNRPVLIRPNVFLSLMTLLALAAIVTSFDAQFPRGTGYRTFRLIEFVIVLWLLSPYWGRRDLLLARCHLRVMIIVLGSVLLGLAVSPGHALEAGRLGGAIWPIPATQVAHYSAVTIGMVSVFWLCGQWRGRSALVLCSLAGVVLILTHTRTALVALIAGILIAGLSMIVARTRVRKTFAGAAAVGVIAGTALSGFITKWLARGQGAGQLTNLSGRTTFWGPLLAYPRDRFQELFGFGLSNDSFGGLPIDSNWLASYQDQGLFGVTICAAVLITLLFMAALQPRGVRRALALFLVIYCLIASFTEVGFTGASPYLLDLTVAASLLVPSMAKDGSA